MPELYLYLICVFPKLNYKFSYYHIIILKNPKSQIAFSIAPQRKLMQNFSVFIPFWVLLKAAKFLLINFQTAFLTFVVQSCL